MLIYAPTFSHKYGKSIKTNYAILGKRSVVVVPADPAISDDEGSGEEDDDVWETPTSSHLPTIGHSMFK
ncbi:hypothetical protein QQF64_036171 [Cirrhinus molitorella]|uniref:Uncharacterized protein n=1 Tax=Cirrhinus molitorella TaxID=172907 RepID=A0ABR3NIN7_9TELE